MDVKWIKICTDIFDDEKIALIDAMPDRDGILVIWFKLLCLAGKQNNGGVFMLNDKIAYTDEMLATIFRRPLNNVRMALSTFEQFGMVEIVNGAYTVPNWEKHQNIDRLEQEREKNRKRVEKFRAKQKMLTENSKNNDCNVTVMLCNDTEKIREDKKRLDYYKQIKDLYNETCVSFPRLTALSDKRKQTIKARLNTYTIEKIKEVFQKAEASDFLKGKNNRDWQANFDWLMKDSNFAKVLDGNYDNKKVSNGKTDNVAYDLALFEKMLSEDN